MRLVNDVGPDDLIALFEQTDWAKGRTTDDVRVLLHDPSTVFVAARDDAGRLVGFARALSDGRYRAMIEDVVVDAANRGQGLGRMLITALMAKLDGVERIFLMTGGTTPAFYAEFGFRQTEPDLVVMQWDR